MTDLNKDKGKVCWTFLSKILYVEQREMIRLVTGGRYTGQFIIQTDNFVENETGRPRDWRGDTDTATFDL